MNKIEMVAMIPLLLKKKHAAKKEPDPICLIPL